MTRALSNGASRDATFDAPSNEFFRRDPEHLRILAHPLRLKILKLAGHREVSAKEASVEMDEPIGKVSYHVRVLADAGFLHQVRQTPRRGAIETHYRARVLMDLDEQTWDSLSATTRRMLMTAVVQEWSADVVTAADAGGFEIDDSLVGNAHFEADEEGLDEIRRAIEDHYERLLEIEAGIAERRRAAPELPVTEVNTGLTFYEGTRTYSSNGPFFLRSNGRTFPLIPEHPDGLDVVEPLEDQ